MHRVRVEVRRLCRVEDAEALGAGELQVQVVDLVEVYARARAGGWSESGTSVICIVSDGCCGVADFFLTAKPPARHDAVLEVISTLSRPGGGRGGEVISTMACGTKRRVSRSSRLGASAGPRARGRSRRHRAAHTAATAHLHLSIDLISTPISAGTGRAARPVNARRWVLGASRCQNGAKTAAEAIN